MAGSWLGRALGRGRGVPEEAELVAQAQRGSEDALAALFDLHWPRLFRAALTVTADAAAAEDVAQEAFIAAVRALDRFDRSRPFGPWLHRIAVNRAIDHARTRAARRELGGEVLPEPGVQPAEPGGADRVAALVAALPPEQRAVVALRYLLEYTPGEIADLLELPRGTVNSRLRRGLDALAARLGEEAAP